MKWEKVKIKDFTSVITGGTPSTTKNEYWEGGDIPWLNSGELNQDIIQKTSNFITESGLQNSSARLMPKDSVLIALTGTTTGKTAYLTFEACANQSVTGVVPSPKHIPKYLYYYLSSIRSNILSDAYGGAQKHISQQYVKEIEVPLPPLHIQQQIADTLEKADALRRKDQELLNKYDELAQAIFYDMFGDPVRNEKGWVVKTIRDVSQEVKYGTSSPSQENGKYPYLRMNNITYSGELDLSSMKYIDMTPKEYEKYGTRKGDLLFNRTNSKELVGKTTVVDVDTPMILAGYLIRVRFTEDASPYFVSAYLNTKEGKTTLMGMCKSIIGMANINAQELQDIKIIIPPISLQEEFYNRVNNVKKQKKIVKHSIKESENIFNKTLETYMS